jgi:hypothetical protein
MNLFILNIISLELDKKSQIYSIWIYNSKCIMLQFIRFEIKIVFFLNFKNFVDLLNNSEINK